jgi:hypothetical protein
LLWFATHLRALLWWELSKNTLTKVHLVPSFRVRFFRAMFGNNPF